MTLTVHGIPNCDTVKKARAWLDARGVAYAFHDYKKLGIDAATLGRWADGLGWEVLLNRAGTTFRALPDADKADIDRGQAIALMVAHPSLIKRPVVEGDGILLAGFKLDAWLSLSVDLNRTACVGGGMERSATDIMQEALVAAVLDAVVAWKAASGGLANALARDLGAVHPNTTLADLPKEVQAALRDSTRATFGRLLKEGYTVAKGGAPQPPRPRPTGANQPRRHDRPRGPGGTPQVEVRPKPRSGKPR